MSRAPDPKAKPATKTWRGCVRREQPRFEASQESRLPACMPGRIALWGGTPHLQQYRELYSPISTTSRVFRTVAFQTSEQAPYLERRTFSEGQPLNKVGTTSEDHQHQATRSDTAISIAGLAPVRALASPTGGEPLRCAFSQLCVSATFRSRSGTGSDDYLSWCLLSKVLGQCWHSSI